MKYNLFIYFRFKYHLVDLQFIERISRWINESQVKIKIQVAASNRDAKRLNELIHNFEIHIDSLERPNPDKIVNIINLKIIFCLNY